MDQPPAPPLALIGLMGAGKSSVAHALGERLGGSVADLDAMIESIEGCTIGEWFARAGEVPFRRRESELLAQVVEAGVGVIACGGGIVTGAANRRLLRERCRVAWLEVRPAEALRRIGGPSADPARGRPMLGGGPPLERLEALLAERSDDYAATAHFRVITDGRPAADIVEDIARWAAPPA